MAKFYPKIYEDVFTAKDRKQNRGIKKCKIDKVSTDYDFTTEEYIGLMQKTIGDFEINFFNELVKIVWLMRRYCYKGKNRTKNRFNGFELDGSFGVFMRYHVGYEHRLITRNQISYKLTSYIKDFFPDFNALNPFKDEDKSEFEYPYKHISLGFLTVVYQMPERIELLEHAEKNKMKYTEFLDYVLNYIENYNADKGYDYYIFYLHSYNITPYVGINKSETPHSGINRAKT